MNYNYEKELDILKELKNQLLNSNSLKEKKYLMNDYFNIVAYLYNLGIVDGVSCFDDLSDEYKIFSKHNKEVATRCKDDYLHNMDIINDITNNLLKIYKNNPIINGDYCKKNSIKLSEGIAVMASLFNDIDLDLYKLFNETISNNYISLKKGYESLGACFNATYKYNSYIILKDENSDYRMLSTLAHEMGHAYEGMIMKNNNHILSKYALGEVSSLFLQKLYDHYIIDNHDYKEKALYENMVWYNTMRIKTMCNEFTNALIRDDNILDIEPRSGIITKYDSIDLTPYINENNRFIVLNCDLNLDNYLYVLSDVVANTIVKIYYESPIDGLEILKNFILNTKRNSYRNNLEEYGSNLKYTENEIKTVFTYQKKYLGL